MATVVFDLDGTIVKTDLLHEQVLRYVKLHPFRVLQPLIWLMQYGRAGLKKRLFAAVPVVADNLPYRSALVERASAAKALGDCVVLASASTQDAVNAVADHLGCFSYAIGSDGENLKGQTKLNALLSRHASADIFYVGDSHADLPIWSHSGQGGIAVNPSWRLQSRINRLNAGIVTLNDRPSRWRSLIRAMRTHQWVKNLLLFLPIVSAHTLMSPGILMRAAIAAFAFSLTGSCVYLLNDLFDLDSDRSHPSKRHRPLAAGDLPIADAILAIPVLIGIAIATSLTLPPAFLVLLATYFLVNIAYTLRLKQLVGLDVIVLASLYSFRVFAGGVATDTPLSTWLIAFTTFFFFALALLKRYIEVRLHERRHAAGRGYVSDDAPVLLALGSASHFVSLFVLALYLSNPTVSRLYPHPDVLWLVIPPMMYWVMRIWIGAHRGTVDDDPVRFAVRDPVTYAVLLLSGIAAYFAARG